MQEVESSPEQEALDRVTKALKVFEAAMDEGLDNKSLSSLDTYRKLVAEAARLRVVLRSQVKAEPLTKRLRIAAGQDFVPERD